LKKLLFFAFVSLSLQGFAQSFYSMQRPRNTAVSGGIGSSMYFGELSSPAPMDVFKLLAQNKSRYSVVFGGEYFFLQRLSLRSELTVFRLSEADANSENDEIRDRNLSFRSTNGELNLTASVSLLPLTQRFDRRSRINIHAFGGVALFTLKPRTTLDGKSYTLRQFRTEGQDQKYSWVNVAIPVGVGLRIKTTMTTSLVLEAGYRLTFTDYIDDVSGVVRDESGKGRYPTAAELDNDPIRIALANRSKDGTGLVRGSPGTNDGYFLFNAKLEYYFPEYLTLRKTTDRKIRNIRTNNSGRR
jgi:hypothetical protein